jgi:serine/threonine-protein kinase SRK2
MSPELINSNRGGAGGGTGKGYDGALADVWAAGVLLIVMLLGTFPFDHTEHPDPNTSEAHLEVWLQQVRQPWTGLPHIKAALGKLSPECTDLLNKIFVIDDKKRICVPAIKAHPWYTRPLSSKHAAAEAAVAAAQAKVAAGAAARKTNARLVAGRTSALEKLVDAAATRAVIGPGGPATSPLVNIDLSTSAVMGAEGEGGGGSGDGGGDGAAAALPGPPATGGARGSVDLAGIAEGDGDEEGGEDSRHGGAAAAAAAAKAALRDLRGGGAA